MTKISNDSSETDCGYGTMKDYGKDSNCEEQEDYCSRKFSKKGSYVNCVCCKSYEELDECEEEYFPKQSDDVWDEPEVVFQRDLLKEDEILNSPVFESYKIEHKIPPSKNSSTSEYQTQFLDFIVEQFNNPKYSDVIVKTEDGTQFYVLKILLSSQSSVFQKIFEDPKTKESRTNIIKIDKCNSDVVERMLRYIYSGKLEITSQLDSDLFNLANRYGLKHLKKKCLDYMSVFLRKESIFESLKLTFADDVAPDFQKRVLEFTLRHFDDICEKDAWPKFAVENVSVINELIKQKHGKFIVKKK